MLDKGGVRGEAMADEKGSRTERPVLKVMDGGCHALEEQLLREFMHLGVDNLERVRTIARALRPRGKLRVVGASDGDRR